MDIGNEFLFGIQSGNREENVHTTFVWSSKNLREFVLSLTMAVLNFL